MENSFCFIESLSILQVPLYIVFHTFVSATLMLPEYLDPRLVGFVFVFVFCFLDSWLIKGNESLT